MRTKKTLREFAAGVAGQLFIELLALVVRTVFIYTLSKAYLGISGLFSSILTVLNISELGIGSAIAFALYKPYAEKDTAKMASLMQLYKKAYRIIGFVFLGAGLVVMPFLPFILKETTELVNIYFIYLLYLLNSCASYWFFSYKSVMLSVSQRRYQATIVRCVVRTATSALMVVSLLIFKSNPTLSFYIYTVLGILFQIVVNLVVARKVDRLFPFLKDTKAEKLEKTELKSIFKNISALSISKISGAALKAVDNIVISTMLVGGVSVVGVYSNYTLFTTSLSAFMTILANAVNPAVGNLYATESVEKNEKVFNCLNLLYFWMYSFCFICLWNLYNPFIGGVWINESWVLSDFAVFLISFNFLLLGIMGAPVRFIHAGGLYWNVRFRYVISAVLNIGLSILLAGPAGMGFEGVLLATTVSLLCMTALDPYIVFKHIFHKSPVRFYLKYVVSLLLSVGCGALIKLVCWPIAEYNFTGFAVRLVLCLAVPNLLWWLLFRKTEEFTYMLQAMKKALISKRKKS